MSKLSSEQRNQLIENAFIARESAYSPYSKFRVGAALLTEKDQIIRGANVENASHGATICAERTALVKAVSEGIKSFKALAVTSDVKVAISPCGICRQFIREFCSSDMPVLMIPADYDWKHPNGREDGTGKVVEMPFGELLPFSFGPEYLELPRGGV